MTNDGFQSHADMAAAFRASGAKLACLCASDELYAREAVEAARTLRDAGPAHMYLAGRPGDLEGKLKAAGVGTFVFVDCDALAILRAAYDIIQRHNSRMS